MPKKAIVVVFIFKSTRILCLEHARTHAFGVGRQTQLAAVGWVLFICILMSCCLRILPFVLVLVFLDVPLCFLCWVVFCLLACSFSMFVLLGWCLSFCRALSCIVQKRGKGGGVSRPAATPPVSSHPRDRRTQPGLAGSRMRDTDEVARLQHTSSRANSSSRRLASFALFAAGRVSAALGEGGRWGKREVFGRSSGKEVRRGEWFLRGKEGLEKSGGGLREDLGCTAKQQQVDRVARRSERELRGQPRLVNGGKCTRRVPARCPRAEDVARRRSLAFCVGRNLRTHIQEQHILSGIPILPSHRSRESLVNHTPVRCAVSSSGLCVVKYSPCA